MQLLIEYKPLEMVNERYQKLKKIRRLLKLSLKEINHFKLIRLSDYNRISELKTVLNFDSKLVKDTIDHLQ